MQRPQPQPNSTPKYIYNPRSEDFVCTYAEVRTPVPYTVRAHELAQFPTYLANHIAKHLAQRVAQEDPRYPDTAYEILYADALKQIVEVGL